MSLSRRSLLAAAALVGCAEAPIGPGTPAGTGTGTLTPWRTVAGGFLTPPAPPGTPPRPGTGMFVKLVSPAAVALRGPDLLVADLGTQRVWRIDPLLNHAIGIAGAPATPGTALALGPDLSAWVLDAPARQVLRFARDGRLMQTYRVGTGLALPVAFALADGGATLLVADAGLSQWVEQRSPGGLAQAVLRRADDDRRIGAVDAIALAGDAVFVLDRAAGAVHRTTRDGRVTATLGRGELKQPSAIAVDREGRVFVVDELGRTLVMLGESNERWNAPQLGVQRIGGLAIDESTLALADAAMGQVALLRIRGTR